jgi:hypothetical protein
MEKEQLDSINAILEVFKFFGPMVISIIGIILTYFAAMSKVKSEIHKAVNDDRRKIYIEAYKMLNQAVIDPKIVFEDKYYEELLLFIPDIYFIGSNDVVCNYKKYGNYVRDIVNSYKTFESENDIHEFEEDEEGNQIPKFTIYDEEAYERKLQEYKKKNHPDYDELKGNINNIVQSMRRDIGII